ncbi:MAG: cytochrome c maturation protein CcmE [Maricaulaceae bacterium]|jgi:cytochrome c-type biogenesis protein CcmE
MRKSRQRLIVIASAAAALSLALVLVVIGLRSQVAFFQTPSEVLETAELDGRSLRVGGLVTTGSVRTLDGAIAFELADDVAHIEVVYAGVLPSLFREGQCVIAEGAFGGDGRLAADRILAKHDETYQPREIGAAPRLAQSCGFEQTAAAESATG